MLPEDSPLPTEKPLPPASNLPPAAAGAAPTAETAAFSGADAGACSPYASPALEPVAATIEQPAPPTIPRRPRVWPVFVLYFTAFVVAQVLATIALVAVGVLLYGASALTHNPGKIILDATNSAPGLLTVSFVSQAIIGGAALAAALLSPVAWRRRLRLGPGHLSYGTLAVSVIGALALSNALSSFLALGLLPDSPMLEYLNESMESFRGSSLLLAMLLIGVLPGIAEELLFRGYIQTRLVQRWGRPWGIGIAAAMFAIMHVDPIHALLVFFIGLYLGYLTERTGSIRPAMVCHALNNLSGVAQSYLGWAIEGQTANLTCLGVCLLLLTASLAWLSRALPFAPELPAQPALPSVPVEPSAAPIDLPPAADLPASPEIPLPRGESPDATDATPRF